MTSWKNSPVALGKRWRARGFSMSRLIFLLLLCPALVFADGAVRIKTDVSQVSVMLDGKELGETPLTLPAVAPGVHKLRLIKPGYEDHSSEIQVQSGVTAKVFVVMKPNSTPLPELPAKFRVAHQHRTGICRGELTVHLDAIDFKGDDGKDVFHIPLKDIRSVSRSWGSVPGMGPPAIDLSQGSVGDLLPLRIDAPGRSYGFAGHVDDREWKDVPLDAAMTRVSKVMFDLTYRLWQDSLDAKKKAAK